jgi:hypothetical protein
MPQRYGLRKEDDGTWTVFDWFTGQPVDFEGETLCGLDIQEADDWVDLMNGLDRLRRGES